MWHLFWHLLSHSLLHAQLAIPGIESIVGDTAEGAAAGSAVPGIGTLIGGIGGIASGLLGMIGGQNQNTANQEAQVQAEQFDEQMSSTAYQRAVADMKAAGINPMLAYMQGGESSPTAPTYTATNTLSDFSSSAEDLNDVVKKYQDAEAQQSENAIKAAEANVAGPMADSELKQSAAKANVATATQNNAIESSNAETAKNKNEAERSGYEAHTAKVNSDWANTDHWNKAINTGVNTAKDVVESIGIGKFLKGIGKKSINPKTTGTFVKTTGEIHE